MTADIGSDILNTVTVKTRDVPRLRYNADEQVLSALIKKFIRSYEKMLKKINLKMILCGVAVLFGIIAVCMFFAPAVIDKIVGEETLSGMQIAFGDKEEGLAVSAYMLPFFLAIAGTLVAVVAMLGKGGKIMPIVAAVCFIGAGICYFLPMVMVAFDFGELGEVVPDAVKDKAKEAFKELFKIGAGAIVGGIFSIIAAVVAVVPVFVCKD